MHELELGRLISPAAEAVHNDSYSSTAVTVCVAEESEAVRCKWRVILFGHACVCVCSVVLFATYRLVNLLGTPY